MTREVVEKRPQPRDCRLVSFTCVSGERSRRGTQKHGGMCPGCCQYGWCTVLSQNFSFSTLHLFLHAIRRLLAERIRNANLSHRFARFSALFERTGPSVNIWLDEMAKSVSEPRFDRGETGPGFPGQAATHSHTVAPAEPGRHNYRGILTLRR